MGDLSVTGPAVAAAAVAAVDATTVPAGPGDPPARFVLIGCTADQAAAVSAALAGFGARVTPFAPPDEWLLSLPGRRFIDPVPAFEAGAALAAAFGIAIAEPDIIAGVMPAEPAPSATTDLPDTEGLQIPGCWVPPDPRIDADRDWALDRLRVPQAWAASVAAGRPAHGTGIVIAQPDTGITTHPELAEVNFAGALNLIGDGPPDTAIDPLGYIGNPGHGTGTASVVVSPASGSVTGSAPGARHLPIRAIDTVVRVSQTNVALAIDRAVELGAHVITMSLGGIYSLALERAVARAVARDVIVLAAAGNCVGIVVWPARFDAAIAVAGSNYDDGIWQGSSHGLDVDVAAPGENVWRASAAGDPVGQGQGTSFAVALTAGVAACWLAHHGRGTVIGAAHAQGETVQDLFRRLARATARAGPGWNRLEHGAGIVDAAALLAAPLDIGQDTEAPAAAAGPDGSVARLALDKLGAAAIASDIDWQRHGQELSWLLLANGPDAESTAGTRVSAGLRAAAAPALLAALGVAPPPAPSPAAPALHIASDASPPADAEASARQRRLLAAGHAARDPARLESAADLESSLPADAPLPATDDLLARVDGIMQRMPADEIGDPVAFRAALTTLYRYAAPGLAKLAPGIATPLTGNEGAALEAIIRADGSRPSFLLADGKLPLAHPMLGSWSDRAAAHWPAMQKLARAVGRIQPHGGSAARFIGTGTLIDRGKGLVLTNYHVVDDARTVHGVLMTASGSTLTIHGNLEIDFVGEAASLARNRFRVVAAELPTGFGRNMGFVDAAVLRIEPIDGDSLWPGFTPKLTADPSYAMGSVNTLATIGFPGPPKAMTGVTGGVDWGYVTATLFGNKFGLKRLAPGQYWQALGTNPADRSPPIAFGHDATTFAGASGSPIIAWTDEGAPVFGLHFAGSTEKSNYAIAFAAVAALLTDLGVKF